MVSTYSEAGVDIDASERATEALIAQIKGVNRKGDGEAIKLDNGFAGLVKLGDGALAMCTDGVGSKILLAEEMDSIHTVGIDCVAMNTNDLICVGAEPLSFVDYVALDKPDEELMAKMQVQHQPCQAPLFQCHQALQHRARLTAVRKIHSVAWPNSSVLSVNEISSCDESKILQSSSFNLIKCSSII